MSSTVFGQFVRTQACGRCGGAGRIVEQPCPVCDGAGRTIEERTLSVDIPPGIHDGQRIRIGGEGHAGALGGRAGDLYVLVHVRPDARFVREGHDIFSTVDLTMTQAALGARVTVPTLEGEAELEFEPAMSPGAWFMRFLLCLGQTRWAIAVVMGHWRSRRTAAARPRFQRGVPIPAGIALV